MDETFFEKGTVLPENISVVVQGPVLPDLTKMCLLSIRKFLPGAQVILSTWEDADLHGLFYDELVLSADPGAVPLIHSDPHMMNNINRQIVSTRNGILRADRKYVLKIRSDIELTSDRFLQAYKRYAGPARHFHSKVLVVDFYTRHPYVVPVPFHPSDWIMLGEREDVAAYYDVPLMPEADMLYFSSHKNGAKFFRDVLHRYTPEQWICLEFLRKKGEKILCHNYYDLSSQNLDVSIKMFQNDFIIINAKECGILFRKYNPDRSLEYFMLMSHKDWVDLVSNENSAKKYCLCRKSLFFVRTYLSVVLEKIGLKKNLHNLLKTVNNHTR